MSELVPGASRRKVLKGAAWTAPVVVMASAAPAFAVSGPAALTTIIEEAYNEVRDEVTVLTVITEVTNANTGSPGAVTTVFTVLPTGGTITDADPTVLNLGAGFVFVSKAAAGVGGYSYTFTNGNFPGAPDATSTISRAFAFAVPVTGLSAGGVNVVTTPTTGASAPAIGRAWI
ncbi:hypothetical protein [Nocardioides sp.]|uniref:hypothetical protein n=1 Tax=Nocardioides sp. TaxID=35761 RepID=UPI002B27AF6F|nr:hypothetical protein [Nocardioides sp.]